MRLLALWVLALAAGSTMARAQNDAPQKAAAAQQATDFSMDPCGNPMLESQGWLSLRGKVTVILNATTFEVRITETRQFVTVHIAGVAVAEDGPFGKDADRVTLESLQDQEVDVLVNPEVWGLGKSHPQEIAGVVDVPKDVVIKLLSRGLARYKEPMAYTVPHYTLCRYRRAEAEAKVNKVGIWSAQ